MHANPGHRDCETFGQGERRPCTVKIANIPVKVARIILCIWCSRLHQRNNTCEVRGRGRGKQRASVCEVREGVVRDMSAYEVFEGMTKDMSACVVRKGVASKQY